MMTRHPFDFPPLPLEQGVSSLSSFYEDPALSRSRPYDLAFALLAAALADGALGAKVEALNTAAAQTRRQLSLLLRIDMSASCRLRLLLRDLSLPEQCLYAAFAAQELCAACVQRLPDTPLRQALSFVLPELLDTLYRFSNWSVAQGCVPLPHELLGCHAEIMPGRPLIACHRHPYDEICASFRPADSFTWLAMAMIPALFADQRALYCRLAPLAQDADGQALLMEAALLAQAHETRFFSLLPPAEPLARALAAQYACAYLLFSWAESREQNQEERTCAEEASARPGPLIAFLRDHACNQLRKLHALCGAELPRGAPALPAFPPSLRLELNKGCIRDTLQSIGETALREGYAPVGTLARGTDFFRYQARVCGRAEDVPSHRILARMIETHGEDYRYEIAPHPVEALRNRSGDAVNAGR